MEDNVGLLRLRLGVLGGKRRPAPGSKSLKLGCVLYPFTLRFEGQPIRIQDAEPKEEIPKTGISRESLHSGAKYRTEFLAKTKKNAAPPQQKKTPHQNLRKH